MAFKPFGRGHGYLGFPKKWNIWIRLLVIWAIFGYLSVFLFSINQFWEGVISLASGLMFSLFSNLIKD